MEAGRQYFDAIVTALKGQGIDTELTVVHGVKPKDAIVTLARDTGADLIVMGAHGHGAFKDLVFGNTINGVRHEVKAPVLVVGGSGK